jgi:hypothetical protein
VAGCNNLTSITASLQEYEHDFEGYWAPTSPSEQDVVVEVQGCSDEVESIVSEDVVFESKVSFDDVDSSVSEDGPPSDQVYSLITTNTALSLELSELSANQLRCAKKEDRYRMEIAKI